MTAVLSLAAYIFVQLLMGVVLLKLYVRIKKLEDWFQTPKPKGYR